MSSVASGSNRGIVANLFQHKISTQLFSAKTLPMLSLPNMSMLFFSIQRKQLIWICCIKLDRIIRSVICDDCSYNTIVKKGLSDSPFMLYFSTFRKKQTVLYPLPKYSVVFTSPSCLTRHSTYSSEEVGFNDPSLLENLQSNHVSNVRVACLPPVGVGFCLVQN